MNFWKLSNSRWNREEMTEWSSIRRTAYILLPLLIYFLIHDMSEILLWAALNQYMLVCGERITGILNNNAYTVRGIINGLAILFGLCAIRKAVRSEISAEEDSAAGKIWNKEKITKYMFLGALALLSAMGLNFLFGVAGIKGASEAFAETARAQYGVDFAVGLVLYGILSPIAEEAVFRGLIFNRMKRCFQFPIALVVSSLLFGFYHGNPVQAVYGAILGLLIAFTYDRYRSFAAPVLFHAVANVSVYVITYKNGIHSLSTGMETAAAVFSLLGAGACFWYIVKHTENCRKN